MISISDCCHIKELTYHNLNTALGHKSYPSCMSSMFTHIFNLMHHVILHILCIAIIIENTPAHCKYVEKSQLHLFLIVCTAAYYVHPFWLQDLLLVYCCSALTSNASYRLLNPHAHMYKHHIYMHTCIQAIRYL